MKKLKHVIAFALLIALSSVLLIGCMPKYPKTPVDKIRELVMPKNGKIRVLQLTDLHLTKGKSFKRDKQTLKWVEEAIHYSNPDLVVVSGDAVGGYYGRDKALIQLANIFEEKQIYWAYTLGNHDGEWSAASKTQVGLEGSDVGNLEIYELLKGYKYSLMTKGEDGVSGVGNYIINYKDGEGKIVHSFIFMDSHGKLYVDGKDSGYKGLDATQVAWYQKSMQEIANTNGSLPTSSLFMHVPLFEFNDAIATVPHIGTFEQYFLESKCYAPKQANGMFEALKTFGTSLVAVGHDHNYNWLRDYQNIYFSYARVSGTNAWERTIPVGATIYDINPTAKDLSILYNITVLEPSFDYLEYAW